MAKYYSQYKQDKFLDKIVFNGKKSGFFIDVGAHDGIRFSNSYFFEKNREWKGICIEPNPNVFSKLKENRTCTNLNICAGENNQIINFTKIEGPAEMLSGVTDSYAPEHLKRINKEVSSHGGSMETIEVKMKRLDSIEGITDRVIDFVSIDTEGNELGVIKSIDFNNINISCFVIENNYNDHEMIRLLQEHGYEHIAKLRCDDVYVHENYKSLSFKLRLNLWKGTIFFKKTIVKILK